MFVNSVQVAGAPLAKGRTKKTSSSGFEALLGADDESPSASAASAMQSAAPTAALFALQEIADPLEGRKKAIETSHSILDELDQLKIDLLAGRVSPQRLDYIHKLVQSQKDRSDPALTDLLAEIELRASVELAKLGRL